MISLVAVQCSPAMENGSRFDALVRCRQNRMIVCTRYIQALRGLRLRSLGSTAYNAAVTTSCTVIVQLSDTSYIQWNTKQLGEV